MFNLIRGGLIVGLLFLSSLAMSQGYTGFEVQSTLIYDENYTSSVTTLRRYHKGFFVDVELFNSKAPVGGFGYQTGSKNSLLDIRVNEDNVKIFVLQRF